MKFLYFQLKKDAKGELNYDCFINNELRGDESDKLAIFQVYFLFSRDFGKILFLSISDTLYTFECRFLLTEQVREM